MPACRQRPAELHLKRMTGVVVDDDPHDTALLSAPGTGRRTPGIGTAPHNRPNVLASSLRLNVAMTVHLDVAKQLGEAVLDVEFARIDHELGVVGGLVGGLRCR